MVVIILRKLVEGYFNPKTKLATTFLKLKYVINLNSHYWSKTLMINGVVNRHGVAHSLNCIFLQLLRY